MLTRPTLEELVTRIRSDLVSRLELVAPVLRASVVYVLAPVIAGAVHLIYGFLVYVLRQIFPDLSEGYYLRRQGALYGITPIAATYASGAVELTGQDEAVIPAGTTLLRSDGARYLTTADATIDGGTAIATVQAVAAGAAGNSDAGTLLSMESPVDGVDTSATVEAGGLSGGSDEEDVETSMRARLLARMRTPPHGGAASDYESWAREVAGVTRAWVYPLELGAGTVVVRFMRDDDEGSAIPDALEIAAVQEHIDEVRPVGAALTVLAPVELVVDYTIAVTPNTAATRAAVEAELGDLHRGLAPGEQLPYSSIVCAARQAAGVTKVTVSVPAGDVDPDVGELPTLGAVTWA